MRTYAIAAGVSLVESDPSVGAPDDIGGLAEQPVPFSDNLVVDQAHVTIGLRQYQNAADRDGHFVVVDVDGATNDVARFLGMAASGEIPQIGN
jgi:hypothetical protein